MFATEWIPPIIARQFSKWRKEDTTLSFNSFAEAEMHLGSYNQGKIVSVVGKKTQQLLEQPQMQIKSRIELQNLFVVREVYAKISKSISVLDIGGACGANYFITENFTPKMIRRWQVVETEKMAQHGKKFFTTKVLQFTTDLQTIKPITYDLLFLQGVLQYLPDPFDSLQHLLKLNPKYIYISRQPLCLQPNQTMIIKQTSWLSAHGPGKLTEKIQDEQISFPCTLLPYQAFLATIKKQYTLVYSFEEEPAYQLKINNTWHHIGVYGWLLQRKI